MLSKFIRLQIVLITLSFSLEARSAGWVVQFNKNISVGGSTQAGVETNGNFIYTSRWDSDTFCRYSMQTQLLEKFVIPGVSKIKDMAWDGTYFYGGSADSIIYKMNFTTKTLVGKIHCPSGTQVRHIAYDPVNDAFWVGNWASNIKLISRTGQVLNSIQASSHGLNNVFGSAYDNVTPGGPYLWLFNQAGNFCDLVQVQISTGLKTGLYHDATLDVAANSTGAKAGGLFIYKDLQTGTSILGGLYQGNPTGVFAYTLSSVYVAKDAATTKLIYPSSSCNLSSNEKPRLTFKNLGFDTIKKLYVGYKIGNFIVTDSLPNQLPPYQQVDFQFQTGIFMGAIGNYSFKVFTSLPGDSDNNNDTLICSVNHTPPYQSPFTMGFENGEDYSGWTFEDANNDSYSWKRVTTGGFSFPACFMYSWNENGLTPADDWLFSNCLELQTGKNYALKFLVRAALSTYPEKMDVYLCSSPSPANQITKLLDLNWITNDWYIVAFTSFQVPADGIFYLGFHAYSAPDNFRLFIDDVVVDESAFITENDKNDNLKMFPNPANDYILIPKLNEYRQIIIHNYLGQTVLNTNDQNASSRIDISQLPNGVYLIQLIGEKTNKTSRFIISR